jgi:hypothetical protein
LDNLAWKFALVHEGFSLLALISSDKLHGGSCPPADALVVAFAVVSEPTISATVRQQQAEARGRERRNIRLALARLENNSDGQSSFPSLLQDFSRSTISPVAYR